MRPHEKVAVETPAVNPNLVDLTQVSFGELQQLWAESRRTSDAVADYTAALAPKSPAPQVVITADTPDAELNQHAARLAKDMGLATNGRLFCYFVLDLQRQIDALKRK